MLTSAAAEGRRLRHLHARLHHPGLDRQRHDADGTSPPPTRSAIGAITRNRLPVFVAATAQLEQSLLGMNFIGTLSGFEVRGDRMILRD